MASASAFGAHELADALAFENDDDDEREDQRQNKIEQAENKQRGEHVRRRRVGHRLEKGEFENAETARRVADQRKGERGEEDAEHDDETGIAGLRQGEIDDARRADQLERPGEQSAARAIGGRG